MIDYPCLDQARCISPLTCESFPHSSLITGFRSELPGWRSAQRVSELQIWKLRFCSQFDSQKAIVMSLICRSCFPLTKVVEHVRHPSKPRSTP